MGEQKGSIKDRIRFWKIVKRRKKEKKQKELQINNNVKKYNKFQMFTHIIFGLFVGIFENLANKSTKNYLDVDPKNKDSIKLFFTVSNKKLDEMEEETKKTNEEVKKENKLENDLKFKPKILNHKEELIKIKEKKKLIEKEAYAENKEELKKQNFKIDKVEKGLKDIDKKIDEKKEEISIKEQTDSNNKIMFDNNNLKYKELKEKINNTNDIYSLCSCEYEMLNLIEKLKNNHSENNELLSDALKIKQNLQEKIELKKKEEVGLLKKVGEETLKKETKKIDVKSNLLSDIENAKNAIGKDIELKENQIKSLQGSINSIQGKLSYKPHLNIIKRLSSTILNTTLGFFSFNWFKNRTIGKIVGSVFICNGLREMRNIVNINSQNSQKRQYYIEFKDIENSLYSVNECINKNNELINDSLEQIASLKNEIYTNYYELKDSSEFKELFNSIEGIEVSLNNQNKKVLKTKKEIQKTKKLIYKK